MENFFAIFGALFMFVLSILVSFLGLIGILGVIYNIRPLYFDGLIYEDKKQTIMKPKVKSIMEIILIVLPIIIGFIYTINYYIN